MRRENVPWLLGVAAIVALLAFALKSRAVEHTAAVTAPNFSMAIGAECHASNGGSDCDIDPSAMFTVRVSLTKTNLPSYRGFQVKLVSPAALPYQNRPQQQEIVWPDCVVPYDNPIDATTYQAGCTRLSAPEPSTYLGEVLDVDYRCVGSSTTVYTITMPQGSTGDNTYVVDDAFHDIDPEGGPSRQLTLRCFGTKTPPASTETPQSTATAAVTPSQPTATSTSTPTAPPSTSTVTPQRATGDINCDDRTDSIDAALVLQFSAGFIGALPCQQQGDVNRDGSVSAIDAALILQYVAGLISDL